MIDFSVIAANSDSLLKGLGVTIQLASMTIFSSFILGTLLGVLRYLKLPVISWFVGAFIEITRAIPLILYIIFIHYTVSAYIFYQLDLKTLLGLQSTQMQSGFLALTLFTSAYVAEIVRSGLNAVESEQVLSAKSMGFTTTQVLRYVVLPISIYRMTPAFVAQFITLIKDTSLVSIIVLVELTRASEFIYENTQKELEVLVFVALMYFIMCYCLSFAAKKITSKPYMENAAVI